MLVKCPFCKKTQQYNIYKQKVKRRRKVCIKCHKKFEIKPSVILKQKQIQTQSQTKSTLDSKNPRDGHFDSDQVDSGSFWLTHGHLQVDLVDNYSQMTMIIDQTDQNILDLISRGLIQAQIAARLKKSRQAISKRIKRLVKLGILIDLDTYPRFYKINPNFLKIDKKKKLCVECHDVRVKLNVKSNFRQFEKFRSKIQKSVDLKHWTKKYLNINNVNFEITTKAIIFHLTGIGETSQDAIDNAKTKAVEVRDYLQKRFNLKLEFPIFHENQIDYTLLKIPHDNYQKLRKLWNDKSHPELLETDDSLLADSITNAIKNSIENKDKLKMLENEFLLLRRAFINFTNRFWGEN